MKYHVAREGQQIGLFAEYEVRDRLRSGELRGSDLYWREGMPDWVPLSTVPELAEPVNPYAAPQADISAGEGREPKLASLRLRLAASILDAAMFFACIFPYGLQEGLTESNQEIPASLPTWVALGAAVALALIVYNIILLTTKGQTIGKRWMKIRIVDHITGEHPGFVRIVLLRGLVNGLLSNIPYFGIGYALIDVLFIFRSDRRCVHDLIAGTHVVTVPD